MRLHGVGRSGPDLAVAAVVLCVLAACGTSPAPSPTSGPTTTPSATAAPTTSASIRAACADIATLKSSVESLTKVNPAKDGAAELTAAIDNVQTSLAAAEASAAASPDLQPGVAKVKGAITALQSATSDVTAENIGQKAPAILAATRQVATAMSALSTAVNRVCP